MKKLLLAIIVLLFVAILLLQSVDAVAPTSVPDCYDLASAGTFYQLANNISGRNDTNSFCIRISADDITLDCQGFAIKFDPGESAANGITTLTSGLKGIRIMNCIVDGDFDVAGLNFIKVSNSNITDSTFLHAGDINMLLQQSHNVNVTRSRMDLGFADGIQLKDSNGSYFQHNVVRFNGQEGLFMTNSNNNTFINNTFRANGLSETAGISLQFSQNNSFFDTSITSSTGAGIRLDVTNHTRFINTYTNKNSPAAYILDSLNTTAYNFSLGGLIVNFTAENITVDRGLAPYPDQPPGFRHIGKFFDASPSGSNPFLFVYTNYTDEEVEALNISEAELRIAKFSTSWNSNTTTFAGTFGVDADKNVIFANITNFGSTFAPVAPGTKTLADIIQERLGQPVELSLSSAQASFAASERLVLKRTVQCGATLARPAVASSIQSCYNYTVTNTGNVPDVFTFSHESTAEQIRIFRGPSCGHRNLGQFGLTLPKLFPGESEEFSVNVTLTPPCPSSGTLRLITTSTTCSGETVATDQFTQSCGLS
jgi:parallel beta-helix repeat protein